MSPTLLIAIPSPLLSCTACYKAGNTLKLQILNNNSSFLPPSGEISVQIKSQFKNEVGAYKLLKEVQGVLVPCPYAVMRLLLAEEGPAGEATHLDVYVIILQAISGPTLEELPETPSAPSTEQEFTSIVQHAVDTTPQFVKWGILLEDSAPRSVMLDQSLNSRPFFVDFAQ
ncbi:hypothetical protein DER45DRAFT_648892 [Fusarium avenaceum]|nr:hypothetical protein DER45DRAFT_648892 [Fusarium avenaceum]